MRSEKNSMSTYSGAFRLEEARHLLCRGEFAAPMNRTIDFQSQGLKASVEQMLGSSGKTVRAPSLGPRAHRVALRNDLTSLQGTFLLQAARTTHPLSFKMALFWHDHFACGNRKVNDLVAMNNQMNLFLELGLGSFQHLLAKVARDPAMLVFLDGAKSSKEKPNENFAREVMELFTLGEGHYSENDVKEAARAFAGWRLAQGSFYLDKQAQDTGNKRILGKVGNFDGDDVLEILVKQKSCSQYLARKLCFYFLGSLPKDNEIDDLARVIRQENFCFREILKRFLSSRLFFDDRFRVGRIKSPVEFVLGVLRSLEARFSGTQLARLCDKMGQSIFDPPGVDGWPEGRSWINSTTIVARHRFVHQVVAGATGPLKCRFALPSGKTQPTFAFCLLGAEVSSLEETNLLETILSQPQAQLG